MNILLTCVGRRAYLVEYFKEAMVGIGEVHTINSHFTIAMEAADAHFIAPSIYHSDYIPALLEYCIRHKINAVLSLLDLDLMVLTKNKKKFEENGIKIISASEESIRICNDKWLTYSFLTNHHTFNLVKANFVSGISSLTTKYFTRTNKLKWRLARLHSTNLNW